MDRQTNYADHNNNLSSEQQYIIDAGDACNTVLPYTGTRLLISRKSNIYHISYTAMWTMVWIYNFQLQLYHENRIEDQFLWYRRRLVPSLLAEDIQIARSHLNIKTVFLRFGDPHVKDKTVTRQHKDPYTRKTTSLYWDGAQVPIST